MGYPDEAEGFRVDSPGTFTTFHKRFLKLKPFGDYACGVCGSDVHTISGGSRSKEKDARKLGADGFIATVDVHGRWISVGLPEENGQLIKAQNLIQNGVLIGASHLSSRREMLEMLQLAADKDLNGWVQEIQISEEGLKEAMLRMKSGDVHYRFTLTGYDKVF